MLEELLHRRPETRSRPDVAEAAPKITKARNQSRFIERAAESAANERCRGFSRRIDGLIHLRHFSDREATIKCI
jgi:hypothetical protein